MHRSLLRRDMKLTDLCETPVCANLQNGELCVWVMLDTVQPAFNQQTVMRKAMKLLLQENPDEIHIVILGTTQQKRNFAECALHVAWVNGAALPVRKNKPVRKALTKINLYGYKDNENFKLQRALAEGNLLARGLVTG